MWGKSSIYRELCWRVWFRDGEEIRELEVGLGVFKEVRGGDFI